MEHKALCLLVSCTFLACAEVTLPADFADGGEDQRETATCVPPCEEGETCVADNLCMAITPDLDGRVCEFHDACAPDEYCVQLTPRSAGARCTRIECRHGDILPCYSGPVGSSTFTPCREGVRFCSNHGFFSECEGEITPVVEQGLIACNGQDDDCDGTPDLGTIEDVDIVFAFDISGSMTNSFAATAAAISELAMTYDHPSIRLGLVLFPVAQEPDPEWIPMTVVPLENVHDFLFDLVLRLLTAQINGGSEASWDVPWMLANSLQPGIFWRPEAKRVIIMFTDEQGQSYMDFGEEGCSVDRDLTCDNTEETMCQAVEDNNVELYVLTSLTLTYTEHPQVSDPVRIPIFEDFDDCATIYELTTDTAAMVGNLTTLADAVCDTGM